MGSQRVRHDLATKQQQQLTLLYCYLENSLARGAQWASIHAVAKESDAT